MHSSHPRSLGLALALGALFLPSTPQSATTETVELSLEDLMNLKIEVGTLTGMARNKIPVSLTTISHEDIAATPARNLYDLIEVYVPGANVMDHTEGLHWGVRGVMADRNYKFLMLVNGRNMNQSAHAGGVTELQNWDLNDVERVEVIRAPGSVTYGAGAIQGVINIVTRDGGNSAGFRAGVASNVTYGSNGLWASHGGKQGDLTWFLYGSATKTAGAVVPIHVSPDSTYGYVGQEWKSKATSLKDTLRFAKTPILDHEASNALADYQGIPQFKLHMDLRWKELQFLSRFTTSGTTQSLLVNPPGDLSKGTFAGEDEAKSVNQMGLKQFLASVRDEHKFTESFRVNSRVDWNDQEFQLWVPRDYKDRESLRNFTHLFSEKNLTVNSVGIYELSEKYKLAAGAEYVRTHVGAPWFQPNHRLRMGDNFDYLGDTSSSQVIYRGTGKAPLGMVSAGKAQSLPNGIDANTLSFMAEANLEFHPWATFLISGRADKNTYTKWGISPRVAWIAQPDEHNVVKLIWQQSVRMNTLEQAWLQDKQNTVSDPEVLRGTELIWDWTPLPELTMSSSGFYNDYDIIGYNPPPDIKTKPLGNLKTAGGDIEARYRAGNWSFGASHSYTKQLEWTLSDDPKVLSTISSSDARTIQVLPSGDTLRYAGVGNDLLNWSNHATKAFVNWKVAKDWTLHLDGRLFWGYEGSQNEIQQFENAVAGLPAKDSVYVKRMREVLADLRSHDIYEMDGRLNASVTWAFAPGANVNLYCQNLVGLNDNKRYGMDTGGKGLYPNRQVWLEEPRTFGFKVTMGVD